MGYKFIGEDAGDFSGISVASAGDVDGDGRDDVIIAGYYGDGGGSDSGEVYLIAAADLRSADAADGSIDGEIDLRNIASRSASYKFLGESSFDIAGVSIDSVGDIDRDGRADLIIGAFWGDGGGTSSGESYLIAAADLATADAADGSADGQIDLGNIAAQSKSYKFVGEDPYDNSGLPVASAGDVDGDGRDDLIIGAREGDSGGERSGQSYLVTAIDLANADYVDGNIDGRIDLTYIASQSTSYKFIGEDAGDFSGRAVASAGDVDGDGRDDLIIGASLADGSYPDSGVSYLVMAVDLAAADAADGFTNGIIDLGNIAAQTGSYKFLGESSGDSAGSSVASAGDVDGDGRADIVIRANGGDGGGTNSGESYLVAAADLAGIDARDGSEDGRISLGLIRTGSASYKFIGESYQDSSGRIRSAGDVDGDGLDDLIISAAYGDGGGTDSGESYLITAADLADADAADGFTNGIISLRNVAAQSTSYKFVGETSNDRSGISIDSAGDVDGDGRDDLIIGAHLADDGGASSGSTYLIFASDLVRADAADGVTDGQIDLENIADPSDNIVQGTSGKDVMNSGYADADGTQIDGSDGIRDIVLALAGNDTVNAGIGDDSVNGGDGNDVLRGQGGKDVLDGGAGGDTLWGGTDTDTLNGDAGDDFLYGQNGNDRLLGSAGADRLYGGQGDDTLSGGGHNDRLFGQTNNDVLRGNDGADVLIGADGIDSLGGGAGDDRLIGGRDDDTLDGGAGNDLMIGGSGSDRFVFAQGYDIDRANRYEQGTDILRLDDALWGGGLTGQQVVDTYGDSNAAGSILTLDFGNGDILEVQSTGGIDAATLGADVLVF